MLNRATIDNRLAVWLGPGKDRAGYHVEAGIATAVYYLIMLFVLIAFFQALRLTLITEPLNCLLNKPVVRTMIAKRAAMGLRQMGLHRILSIWHSASC